MDNYEEKNKVNKRDIIYVIIFSMIIGIIAQILSYSNSYVLRYRDAIFRLEKAREFFDTTSPGFISHLGTVWLPVSHIITSPFAYFDNLWYSGLAGSIVGYICFVFNVLFIYLILQKYIKNNFAVIIGLLVYSLNPNLLYFQTTALTEQPYLLFISGSFYFLLEYFDVRKTIYLMYSGLFIALAMGTRYDGWVVFLVTFILLFLTISGFKQKSKPIITFSVLPLSFLIFWFSYNLFYYGDALEFSRGRYSTLHQLEYYEQLGRLPTKFSLLNSLDVTLKGITAYAGIILCIFTLTGIVLYAFQAKYNSKSLAPFLLLIPLPLMFLLLYFGQIIIELPNTEPPGYFNSRYAISVLPAIAFFVSFFIQWIIQSGTKAKNFVLIIIILLLCWQQYYYYSSYPGRIPAIAEAIFCSDETTNKYNDYLSQNYDGGKVLYDFTIFALSPKTKINLRDRLTYFTPEIGKQAVNDPKTFAKWVLYYSKSSNDSIYINLKDNKKFHDEYNNVFSYGGVEIFKIK